VEGVLNQLLGNESTMDLLFSLLQQVLDIAFCCCVDSLRVCSSPSANTDASRCIVRQLDCGAIEPHGQSSEKSTALKSCACLQDELLDCMPGHLHTTTINHQ